MLPFLGTHYHQCVFVNIFSSFPNQLGSSRQDRGQLLEYPQLVLIASVQCLLSVLYHAGQAKVKPVPRFFLLKMHATGMKSSTGGGETNGSHTLKDQYAFLGQVVLETYLTVERDLTRWNVCEGLLMEGTAGCLRKRRRCVSLGV